ncbi:transglycosylase domain-containing protein [Rhodopila sp.]|uniref:transglycosylase domain-containing protein n=1 Tax=Rhodopila sp. TaxID=2480087 RepID=UPI002C12964D|nr:PBP1A family penicillin-binding protein [Rhodopila sp.]HVZ07286.1 PBP1A family penicillin-binding protein [Rhodopila sp.]
MLWLLRWGFIGTVWGSLAAVILVLWFARDLPRPEDATDPARRPSLVLQDRNGRTIANYGDLVGEPLRLNELPPALPAAIVAVEDRRFWHHPGIDPIGLARAAWVNLTSGRVVQGGSTLTQQVAKTLFLSNARTVRRKVQELLLTLWLEEHFTKREILEIYLNRVYLGAGAWGVDAGARTYFGVSARKVTVAQAAVLAGLPRAPSRFNPRSNPAAAAARAREVLAAMVEAGAITAAQAQEAAAQIAFPPSPVAPGWFADWVAERSQALVEPGHDAVLRTTLDSRYQTVVEKRLSALLAGPAAAAGVTQGAAVILDAGTGAVRAMVGGRDYRDSPFNRAVLARRQPGSAFKPFVWLAALQKGLTPDDTVLDSPLRIGTWSPVNFERRYLGEITLEEALAQSINTAAVRLLIKAGGPKAVASVAARMGIADRLPNDASLALGTGEVGLLELTAAYAPFFNGGDRIVPHGLEQTPHGRVQVMTPEEAAMMQRMLTAVVTRGTGRSAFIAGRDIAGKTGTTQDSRDAWFIGHLAAKGAGSGNGLLIGVWLGNDDNAPTRNVQGGTLPARLFHDIALGLD